MRCRDDARHFFHVERLLEVGFEFDELGSDRPLGPVDAGENVGGLQAVARDAEDGGFVGQNAILAIEIAGASDGDSACGFGEDAFGFGEQSNGIDDFGIADVFAPSAAAFDGLDRVVAVGGVADGDRARDGRGLLRLDLGAACFYGRRDRRAACGLRRRTLLLSARPSPA